MLQTVGVGVQRIDCYEESAGAEAIALLRELAEPLRGLRVLHLNATPYGGGVAEILRSEVPLLRDLGIEIDWNIIIGDQAFFAVTKQIHNGLQGASYELSTQEKETYIAFSTRNAQLLEEGYDIIMVHDPQPLAMLQLHGGDSAKWIWRCHIDTSEPHPAIWDFIRPYVHGYDAAVFTLDSFVPHDFPLERVEIIQPAIDPESPKNMQLAEGAAQRVLQWIGIDLERPLITQVGRFDPWKDPAGVIDVYKRVKREIPELQLALVGAMALDDPEGWDIYRMIQDEADRDHDLHAFTNLTGVGNIEVNAFQRMSHVVIQKSIREGFGLVISEALWKHTPVVAGRAGGIPLQLQDYEGGFLVDDTDGCVEKTCWLLEHPERHEEIVEPGYQRVRDRFLLPRLIADELRLYAALASPAVPAAGAAS